MASIRWTALAVMALPALAAAQVGPNPAVKGGSLDPTVGPSSDARTAPQDVDVGRTPTTTVPTSSTATGTTVNGNPVDDDAANSSAAADTGTQSPPDPKSATAPISESKRKKPN